MRFLFQTISEIFSQERAAEHQRRDGLRERIWALLAADNDGRQLTDGDVAELVRCMKALDLQPADLLEAMKKLKDGGRPGCCEINSAAERQELLDNRTTFPG